MVESGLDPSAQGREARTLTQIAAVADRYAGLLLDWDGCLAISNRLLPEAIRFLKAHQDRVAIVSNNSTDLPEDFSRALAHKGINIPPQRVLLAGAETLALATRQRGNRAMVLGNRKMSNYGQRLGLSVVRTEPELVLLLRDTKLSYARLAMAANALLSGARLLIANPDRTHPGEDGSVVPETGALLAALMACVGTLPVDHKIIGKPGPHLFWRACEVLGVEIEDTLMIGDNPDTDIAGARALGMQAMLVDVRGERTNPPGSILDGEQVHVLNRGMLSTA